MINILVTGSNGQLGSEIRELVEGEAKATHSDEVFYFTDSSSLDITDVDAVKEFIELIS